ncbi:hypothetical protein MKEN_00637600 [Mycena kentingensis (nom. inval.)]|nr:hypothetical protein MKEN_00637600 [Mycena kentingensis (nom. inval.)]
MIPLPPSPVAVSEPAGNNFQYLADTIVNQEVQRELEREAPLSADELSIRLDQEFERILAKSLEDELREDFDESEPEEFEQEPELESSQPAAPDRANGCFPWPNGVTLLLDAMDNLGRCRFTGAQLGLVIHLLKRLGVRNVPSLKALRKVQKQVHDGFGNAPVKIVSPQGNIFYVSDLRKAVARDFANPLVAPHLNLYPEEALDSPVSERWQAGRMMESPPDQLTPMFSDGKRRWWINEVARLADGRFVIPRTWVMRRDKTTGKTRLTSDVYLVTRSADGVWDCDEEFEADFDELEVGYGSTFTWSNRSREFVPSMPNPKRKLSRGRDLYILGLSVWIDDVSGNKSKQYNKFLVMVLQNTAIPGVLLKQEFHIHFMGASQHVSTAELSAVLRDYVKGTETEPMVCYNANTGREAAVVLQVIDQDADNPQQSEEASHIGCNGRCPCRKCTWGGPKQDQVNPTEYHACHEPGIARTAANIRVELERQLTMATNGTASAIEKRQKETGTKDKLTQYWIERVLAHVSLLKAESPGKSKATIAAEAQQWLADQPGDKMNPLLDLSGFDPARDTPVEILHTILLGAVKYSVPPKVMRIFVSRGGNLTILITFGGTEYMWYHLHSQQWSEADRQLLALRLQSTDISGMNIPPIRGAYMVQYRNNLIGKHYKTIMQTLTFHAHDLCTPEQFRLLKATANLGARVWVPVIDDMEAYIAQLEIAIANVLDAWDAVEPLRILVKIKLHLLPHLPDDIRRFGPAVRFSTETQEGYNAVFRMCSINGNNQAPSRDIATKFASMNNIKHALCGGFWESEDSRKESELDPSLPREWLQPGSVVKSILLEDPVFQRHLGWVSSVPPAAGVIRLHSAERRPAIPWPETQVAKHWQGANEPGPQSLWRIGSSVTAKTGDQIKVGRWVLVREDEKLALGRVSEIVACGARSLVLIERFCCTQGLHTDFGWPVVRRPTGAEIVDGLTSFIVVSGSQLEFGCSVQHDCRTGRCKPVVAGKERQEREDTARDISLLRHTDDDRFVLNMGSVHNFVELTRALPPELSRLKLDQADRVGFHTEMSGKAKAARMSARERAAAKRRETAAKKKAKAAQAAEEAEKAQESANTAEKMVSGLGSDDDDELDEDLAAGLVESDEEGEEEESGDEDGDYIPKGSTSKRGPAAQGGRKQQKRRK